MGLYENVKTAAKAKGCSINKMEQDLGFARSYIAKFKTITPSADKLQKIADYLDVPAEYLVTGKEPEPNQYYLNDETAAMAQEIFENRNLRLLFDAARDADPESLKALHTMALALKRKEGGMDDDAGC